MHRLLLSLLIPTTLLQLALAEGDASQVDPIQQSRSDLIAETHRAICYSGFRSGQHPDRGNGAVNPSDQEILEDNIQANLAEVERAKWAKGMNITTFLFEAFDEDWKGDPQQPPRCREALGDLRH